MNPLHPYSRKNAKSWWVDVDDQNGNPVKATGFDKLKDAMKRVEQMVRKGHRVEIEAIK